MILESNESNKEELTKEFQYELLPEDYIKYDLNFKLIVVGKSGVGKTCLINKAAKNMFEENYYSTIGFEYCTFNIKIDETVIRLQIWDTCGQELYRALISNYYRNSSLAILLYSIDSKDSFEDIEIWVREVRTNSSPDVKIFLIANKVDLENERQVSKKEGEAYAKENKFDLFIEASAKNGFNAKNVFIKAAKILYDDYKKYNGDKKEEQNEEPANNEIKLENKIEEPQINKGEIKKKGCC